jgi:glycosyltransferase involved in cell wall biosynthesis
MSKLSVYVITYNEERNIRACLKSVVGLADELVVVDSYSTDETVKISREFTDKVYQRKFEGFGKQRNEALTHISHEWVLSLDADEQVPPGLRKEIHRLLDRSPEADAYLIPRQTYFLGRWIKHCGFYPDFRHAPLFRHGRAKYRDDLVHERIDVAGRVGVLNEPLQHFPFHDIDQFLSKHDRYSDLMARRMVQQGRRFSTYQLATHPFGAFFKMYVQRAGFLDGMPGLILSGLYAYYTFMKYAKFWELSSGPESRC